MGKPNYTTYNCKLCWDCAQITANGYCESAGAHENYYAGTMLLSAENDGNPVQVIVGEYDSDFSASSCGVCQTVLTGARWEGEILYFHA